jgi:hypothetical protein
MVEQYCNDSIMHKNTVVVLYTVRQVRYQSSVVVCLNSTSVQLLMNSQQGITRFNFLAMMA